MHNIFQTESIIKKERKFNLSKNLPGEEEKCRIPQPVLFPPALFLKLFDIFSKGTKDILRKIGFSSKRYHIVFAWKQVQQTLT